MKITAQLRKEINQAVRAHVSGASPLAEVGLREDRTGARHPAFNLDHTPNALAWDWDEDGLGLDFVELRALHDVPELPHLPGRALLDLYVHTGHGHHRELETNVSVAIVDGHVVASAGVGDDTDAVEAAARGTK